MIKEYRWILRYKILYPLFSIPFWILVGIFFYRQFDLWIGITIFTVTIAIIVSISNPIQERLILKHDGNEYHSFLFAFNARWEDFVGIARRRIFVFFPEVLLTNSAKVEYPQGSIPTPNIRYAYLPLSFFSENWRESELGQHIKNNAPHLFPDDI